MSGMGGNTTEPHCEGEDTPSGWQAKSICLMPTGLLAYINPC
jgi:hypothetical protein